MELGNSQLSQQQEWMTMRVTEPVPEAVAHIRLPLAQLRGIPEGLEVSDTEGHARATVSVVHDTLYVAAHCDSMARKVDYYETRAKGEKAHVVCEEKRVQHNGGWGSFVAVLLCLGLIVWMVGRK